jgi:nicotinate phosphoribosyltransferase
VPSIVETSPALLTDLYELTMAEALWREGRAEVPAVFSLFVRSLPPNRGYLVAAGLDDALAFVARFRFDEEDRAALARLGGFDPGFLDWLGGVGFSGVIRAVPEGRLVFADEPLLEVEGPLAVAQILETALLNQINLQTTLATKAARMRHAAAGRSLVDFALRRAHGFEAGVRVARCSAMVGFAATSNVAAALRYRLPASGTMAHSYVSAHDSELEAFRHFARHVADPVLLVDTFDTSTGLERAIQVGLELEAEGRSLRAIRLDSGELAELARLARRRLDDAGLTHVGIFASGGLDEFDIARLVAAGAPIDGFGVGTALGVSADAPVLEIVYKLVQVDGRPVAKRSVAKETLPCPKQVWRRPGFAGDVLAAADEPCPHPGAVALLATVPPRPAPDPAAAVVAARERFEADWAQLPAEYKALADPAPYPVERSPALDALARKVWENGG